MSTVDIDIHGYLKSLQEIVTLLVFPQCGEVFVDTEGQRFGARVKKRCNEIKYFPVLVQICDPPVLKVLPNTHAFYFDGFMD
jgi:hypothetical protein